MRGPHHYSFSPDALSLRAQYQLGTFSSSKKHQHQHQHQRPYHSGRKHHHHHREQPAPTYYHPTAPPPQHLTNLPPELKLMIHSTLDPVTSTCLGLSSREFYPTHRSLHKKVGLYDRGDRLPLCMYLKEWAPESYGLDWRTERFVPGYGREGKRREREREYHGGRLRRSRKYERLDVASFKWWR